MVDYAKLVDKAKAIQDAAAAATPLQKRPDADPKLFFQRVGSLINEEMEKANVELRKVGIATISRNYLPSFDKVIFLTVGVAGLCRVELESPIRGSRITASISGPPNGNELSRREYLVGPQDPSSMAEEAQGPRPPMVDFTAEEIAQDIISGIVIGTFH
ncbi:MAG: hypothetical protein ABR956_06885 [Terracidiphilus sp.]|jgi:hypothetical protein